MNVVIQLNTVQSEKPILGQIRNILKSEEAIHIELVVHGEAGPLLLNSSGMAQALQELHAEGVAFFLCRNTLHSMGCTEKDLLTFVTIVPSAVVHIIKRQHEGWAYLS